MIVKNEDEHFCPRGAMVAQVLAIALCLSVRLSVTSRSSIETDERIKLVFGTEASFRLSYTALKGNSGISKIRFPLELCPKLRT